MGLTISQEVLHSDYVLMNGIFNIINKKDYWSPVTSILLNPVDFLTGLLNCVFDSYLFFP